MAKPRPTTYGGSNPQDAILLTAAEVTKLFRISIATLYNLMGRDQDPLPSFKVPGVGRRYRRADVDAWFARQAQDVTGQSAAA